MEDLAETFISSFRPVSSTRANIRARVRARRRTLDALDAHRTLAPLRRERRSWWALSLDVLNRFAVGASGLDHIILGMRRLRLTDN